MNILYHKSELDDINHAVDSALFQKYITFLFGFQFIFSTAIDGKIKAWLYDNMGSRVDYDAPGKWCTTMLYSADGTRYGFCPAYGLSNHSQFFFPSF